MIEAAIEKIISLSDRAIIQIDDREYLKQGYTPVADPTPKPLTLHTLTGVSDYLREGVDGSHLPTIIHIVEYNRVTLITGLFGAWKQRELRLESEAYEHANANGRWKSIEDFIIMLNSEFVRNEGSTYLAQLTASITDQASAQIKDNGITQSATIRSGISLVENMEIKNPITLKPYRTFPEIEQPEISFVFRIRKGSSGPECALFESEGGAWKNRTIQAIKVWFENELSDDTPTIIA